MGAADGAAARVRHGHPPAPRLWLCLQGGALRRAQGGGQGRGLKKRKASGGGGKKSKKSKKLSNDCGDSWDEDEEFEVEAIVGTKVSAGKKEDGFRKGVTLYRVVWKDYSAAATTWEPAENIHDEILAEYEAALEAEAQLDAEEAAELAAEEAAEGGDMDTE